MASFTTRVELHGATGADYTLLHEFMLTAGFYRAILGSDGKTYRMPTAEYDAIFDLDATAVCERAGAAAAKTGKNYWIFVTQAGARAWTTEIV